MQESAPSPTVFEDSCILVKGEDSNFLCQLHAPRLIAHY